MSPRAKLLNLFACAIGSWALFAAIGWALVTLWRAL